MKKLLTLMFLASAMLYMDSCGAKQSGSKKDATNTNESIQGTFFGVSFGASKDEVLNAFAAHDFYLDTSVSTEEYLPFSYQKSQYFSFGGLGWEKVNVFLTNGKFSYIEFYHTFKDKAQAIQRCESDLSTVSQKYNLTKEEPTDSTRYMVFTGKSKKEPNREVIVTAYRYESVSKDIYYTASLIYLDDSYSNYVSDEL